MSYENTFFFVKPSTTTAPTLASPNQTKASAAQLAAADTPKGLQGNSMEQLMPANHPPLPQQGNNISGCPIFQRPSVQPEAQGTSTQQPVSGGVCPIVNRSESTTGAQVSGIHNTDPTSAFKDMHNDTSK